MEAHSDPGYQEGGVRHPDAKMLDITKGRKTDLAEITKLTGWWGDEGVLGLEVEHGSESNKGLCELAKASDPPHSASIRLAEGEYLTQVVGQTTGKIERLTFRTSRGTTITFGNDKPDGTSFKLFQKNYRISALNLGLGKYLYFVGAYFTFVQFPSPPLIPLKMPEGAKPEELKLDYPKAITYDPPKPICMGDEKKALEDPSMYGKFDDFEWAIKSTIQEGKKVEIREVMLYFSSVKKAVLGYRLKYEIRDPSKASGKIVEFKHVAPNPLTPTLHAIKILDEGEIILSIMGQRRKSDEGIVYLAMKTSLGNVIEAGTKGPTSSAIEEFVLEGKEEKKIIAFAGKLTDCLNAFGIYCTK